MDMAAQGGHGDEFPGGGPAGLRVAEVVEDGQHFAVGIGGEPGFPFPAENMPVGPADPVGQAAEGQIQKFVIHFGGHGGLVIGQKPKPGGFGLKGVVVSFWEQGNLRRIRDEGLGMRN